MNEREVCLRDGLLKGFEVFLVVKVFGRKEWCQILRQRELWDIIGGLFEPVIFGLLACLAVSVFEIRDQFLTFFTCLLVPICFGSILPGSWTWGCCFDPVSSSAKFLKYIGDYLVLVSSSRNESCIVGYSTKYALQTNHFPLLPKAQLRYLAYLIVELISE